MAFSDTLKNLIPQRFRKEQALVHVVRLKGTIGMGTPLQPSLNAKDLEPLFKRAFTKNVKAVALIINSPGGSAVQSALIHDRIRDLAAEHTLPVYAFVEDVAASGGYWLACAGDEIYADSGSIIGSIGVIYAGFGFNDAIKKLGIERRVHTAGENKSILDPFKPERKEDVKRILDMQAEIHGTFKAHVRNRRAGKLKEDDPELFTGAFWVGQQAMARGLIDGLGHLHAVMKAKFGDKVVLKAVTQPQGWGLRRLGFGTIAELPDATLDAIAVRALWSRYGL
jgi:signal peptide peptidase SppA